jgi:tetratricopeptide (TPR) repeat protein
LHHHQEKETTNQQSPKMAGEADISKLLSSAAKLKARAAEDGVADASRFSERVDRKQRALAARRERLESGDGPRGGGVAAAYERWDIWGEEREAEEQALLAETQKARAAAAQRRGAGPGCNHDKSAEREVFDLGTRGILEACARFKSAGNDYFREGQWYRAAGEYKRVSAYLDYCFPDTSEERAEVDAVLRSALLNLAAAKLKTRQHAEVVDVCGRVLRKDPDCVKALFRRARARRATDDYEAAAEDLERAARLAPGRREIERERQLLDAARRGHRRRSRAAARRMFGGGVETVGGSEPEEGTPTVSPRQDSRGSPRASGVRPPHATSPTLRRRGSSDDAKGARVAPWPGSPGRAPDGRGPSLASHAPHAPPADADDADDAEREAFLPPAALTTSSAARPGATSKAPPTSSAHGALRERAHADAMARRRRGDVRGALAPLLVSLVAGLVSYLCFRFG